MKASELIAQLQSEIDKHGDLELCIYEGNIDKIDITKLHGSCLPHSEEVQFYLELGIVYTD